MSNGSFFKGEKKKKKKKEKSKSLNIAPVFTPPTVIKKGKDQY